MIFTALLPIRMRAGYPAMNHVRRFDDHDTFAAYLAVWSAAGYQCRWSTGVDCSIEVAA
jgi:hypothetical protein